jgi:hypothetical protein
MALIEESYLQSVALAASPRCLQRTLKEKGPAALAPAIRSHAGGLQAMAARMCAMAKEWDAARAGARARRKAI